MAETSARKLAEIVDAAGVIKNFESTGIDDNATSTKLTIDSSGNATFVGTGDVDVSAGTFTTSSINGGQLAGMRNLIINGAMQVAQRATQVTGLASGDSQETVDRWYFHHTEGDATQEQSTDAPDGFAFSNKITHTNHGTLSPGTYQQINYKFEAQDLYHLNYGSSSAKSVTVSFWMKSNVTGNRVVRLYQPTGGTAKCIQAYVTQDVANTWEYKTVTFPGNTSTSMLSGNNEGLRLTIWYCAGTDYSSGGTLQTSWGDYNASTNAVGIDNVGLNNNEYFAITGVQLEVGSTATAFEHRPYGTELALCQRYYHDFKTTSAVGYMGFKYTINDGHWLTLIISPEMRAVPAITQSNWQGAAPSVYSRDTRSITLNHSNTAFYANYNTVLNADAEL